MTNNKIKEFQKNEKTKISGATLYDLNKQIINQTESPMTDEDLYDALDYIVAPFFKKNIEQRINKDDFDNCYFMLLCREDNNYTIFNVRNYLDFHEPILTACDELRTCLKNRGKVYSMEKTEDNYAIEIWLQDTDKGMLCYYLFPYNEGVIEI